MLYTRMHKFVARTSRILKQKTIALMLPLETCPFPRLFLDPARNRAGLSTHNYFISKSIDLTAPGGYVAVISSQHSADSAGRGTSVQQLLTDRADFITGVRLPGGRHGAFSDYAGTEAGTDVLVFRVREDGQEPSETTLK